MSNLKIKLENKETSDVRPIWREEDYLPCVPGLSRSAVLYSLLVTLINIKMKKLFSNVKFFTIWVLNSLYSLKDLRLDTPVSLPTFIISIVLWFLLLTYFFLF
jgi:hypothetical protein